MKNLTIIGAKGRVGSLLISLAQSQQEWRVVGALITSAQLHQITQQALSISSPDSIPYTDTLSTALLKSDLAIDFSAPDSSVNAAQECARLRIPLLIGTTGHSQEQLDVISRASMHTPILLAPNTSLSVFVLQELSLLAAQILGPSFDIEILELHHKMKRDAPSGTACLLALQLAQQSHLTPLYSRVGTEAIRKQGDLSVMSLRGGDCPGEHTVFFLGDGERVEITQRVRDRSVFARGALHLAQKLLGRAPGLYTVKDLLRPPH